MSDERKGKRGGDPAAADSHREQRKESSANHENEVMNRFQQEKPRKLEEETATYLLEIESQLKNIDPNDTETKEILVSNVLSEIQSRTASAACDRRTNFILEQLCSYANPVHLIQLFQKWKSYCIFLARNRYASHVVQTALSRLCFFLKNNLIYSEVDPAVVETTILEFARPLLLEMHWLGREMSATHVIRSLLCVLSGLPIIAEKKGKNSKHQHSVVYSEPIDLMIAEGGYLIGHAKSFVVPDNFKEEVMTALHQLLTKSRRELQLLIADFSSCALVTLLFKIICNPRLYPAATTQVATLLGELLEKVVDKSLLQTEPPSSSVGKRGAPVDAASTSASDTFYAMAGDKSGSYFLETVMTVFPFDHMVLLLIRRNLLGLVKEYAFDHFGNYVLQAALKRLVLEGQQTPSDQLPEGTVDILVSMTEELRRLKEESAEEFAGLLASKGGVFYWLLEALQTFSLQDDFTTVAGWVLGSWREGAEGDEVTDISADNSSLLELCRCYLEKRFCEKGAGAAKDSKAAKEGSELPGDSLISNKLLLSRVIKLFLRYSNDALATVVAKAVLQLSPAAFDVIVNTSQINKNILDTLLFTLSSSPSKTALLKQLSMKMTSEEFATLFLGSFFGLKNAMRMYDLCDLRGREKWIVLLRDQRALLAKSRDGKQFIETSRLDLFLQNPKEWKQLTKESAKERGPATSIVSGSKKRKSRPDELATSNDDHLLEKKRKLDDDHDRNQSADDAEEQEEDGQDGNKRKRKRKRAKKTQDGLSGAQSSD